MKRIEVHVPKHTVVRFRCDVCGQKYKTESAAKECESRALETIRFKVGDRVMAPEKRECSSGQPYDMQGKVVGVIGPRTTDLEEIKWVRTEEYGWSGKHVFQYEVEYTCPVCHEKKTALYFTPELKKSD